MSESGNRPIRVVLVDDHAVVRKGLRALLDREPGIEVVGEAESGERAVEVQERVRPDVVLMDLEMPGIGGTEATRRISEAHPDARIVILTSHAAEEVVFPALKAGAVGYLLKLSAPDEVLRLVARGMSNQEIADHLVVGEATVRSHVSAVLRKLQLSSRTRATLYALREGLASLDDADLAR